MRPDKDDDFAPMPIPQKPSVVLLVEDEVLIRIDLGDYLRQRGFTILEAASVDEAETILGAGVAVDLVFSDINLYGPQNGVDLALWIRSNFSEVGVILTSGDHNALRAAEAVCTNVSAFIQKPYDHAIIERLIRALLRRGGASVP